MKRKLVLATAPVSLEARYGRFAAAASTQPSLALLQLGAVARAAGWQVAVEEAAAWNRSVAATAQRILAEDPELVGISATTVGIVAAGELAAQLKQARPDLVIIVGGSHVTALPQDTLTACPAFDLACVGEGEDTLRELLDTLAAGVPRPWRLAGTAERADETVILNPPRAFIADLDRLPMPDWSLLAGFPGAFRPSPARIRREPCASVVLTRGCPNQCTFCDRSVFGRSVRAYSPEYAVRMVQALANGYGVREILIEDDTFTISRERVAAFARLLREQQIDVTWSCLGRVDRVTPELLHDMRAAGCWHISYGIESADPDVLARIRKRITPEQVVQALRWTRAAGLRSKGFFIVGLPGETAASMETTRRFLRHALLDDISIMQLTPFPGSEIYEKVNELGVFHGDWQRMNMLNTVFTPHGLTRAQLETARARMYRTFYTRPDVLARQVRHVAAHPHLWRHVAGAALSLCRLSHP